MKSVNTEISTKMYNSIYHNIYGHADENPDVELHLWVAIEKTVNNQVCWKQRRVMKYGINKQ